jgi:hypothetical protein
MSILTPLPESPLEKSIFPFFHTKPMTSDTRCIHCASEGPLQRGLQ